MSVKTMLPLIGVGSAVAILGLRAARRSARPSLDTRVTPPEHRMQSGVHPRVSLEGDTELAAAAPVLTSDFWDASPESNSLPDSYGRPPSELEAYDALDPEDLSAEWLTRATEAPARNVSLFDLDDPAEIPTDSVSMISDASRHAALDLETLELDALDDLGLDEGGDGSADRRR